MKVKTKVRIISSDELVEMRLQKLIGRTGSVTNIPSHNKGVFVELEKSYQGEKEWYVPNDSLEEIE